MFTVVEITTYNDGSPRSPGMYAYETEALAIANFHTKFGGVIKQSNVKTEMCMIITEDGQVLRKPNADGTYTSYTDFYDSAPEA